MPSPEASAAPAEGEKEAQACQDKRDATHWRGAEGEKREDQSEKRERKERRVQVDRVMTEGVGTREQNL